MTPEPTWTQAAGETDLVAMRVRLEQVGAAPCGGGLPVIFVNAFAGSLFLVNTVSTGEEGDFVGTVLGGIPAPASAQNRTIAVSARSFCSSGDFRVAAVDVGVLRVP